MKSKLDEILEYLPHLKTNRKGIERTLAAMPLQKNSNYLSIGLGSNEMPGIIAAHGLNVLGLDISDEHLRYQESLSGLLSPILIKSGGSLTISKVDIDKQPLGEFYGLSDIVECLNFHYSGQRWDMSQTLLDLGRGDAYYFISSHGGLCGKDDEIVISTIQQADARGKKFQILEMNLFTSRNYPEIGVLLRVY